MLEFSPKPLGYLGNEFTFWNREYLRLPNKWGSHWPWDSLLCQKQNVAELLPPLHFLKKKKRKKWKLKKKKKLGILLSLELSQGEISTMVSWWTIWRPSNFGNCLLSPTIFSRKQTMFYLSLSTLYSDTLCLHTLLFLDKRMLIFQVSALKWSPQI